MLIIGIAYFSTIKNSGNDVDFEPWSKLEDLNLGVGEHTDYVKDRRYLMETFCERYILQLLVDLLAQIC